MNMTKQQEAKRDQEIVELIHKNTLRILEDWWKNWALHS